MPIIPATQEAEAGESLEPQGGRGCSELRLCHRTPAWATRTKPRLKNKTKQNKKTPTLISCSHIAAITENQTQNCVSC